MAPGALESVFEGGCGLLGVDSAAEICPPWAPPAGYPWSPARFHRSRELSDAAGRSRTQPNPAARGAGSHERSWLATSGRLRRLSTGRRPRRCTRLQSQVREDLPDHRRFQVAAMIFSSPPQFGQCSMSISKAKLQRKPTCTQVMSQLRRA